MLSVVLLHFKKTTVGFAILSKGFACKDNAIIDGSFENFSKYREYSDTTVIIWVVYTAIFKYRCAEGFCPVIWKLPTLDDIIQYQCYYINKFMFA